VRPLDSKGFDRWAGDYDDSVREHSEGYPFEGYYDVLNRVCELVGDCSGKIVLDLGVGTGLLSLELFRQGANVVGVDFSPRMLDIARSRMPKGRFVCADLTQGLPSELKNMQFDTIVSGYAFHHLEEDQKNALVQEAVGHLVSGGILVVADISFETTKDRQDCRFHSGNQWDDSEHYTIAEEAVPKLAGMGITASYEQISCCAGVLAAQKQP
jgi:putative AdoMet-dependent methyltransferase